jgi:putative DNA primase/helicase
MNPDSLARALEARRSGSSWVAKFPAHDDNNPSLNFRKEDGKVLVHCHAGCAQRDVIAASTARGLWQPEHNEDRRIIATYDYTDQDGNLRYQVVRYQPKDFRQRRPDGCDGEIILSLLCSALSAVMTSITPKCLESKQLKQ